MSLLMLAACGSNASQPDAQATDAGASDAGADAAPFLMSGMVFDQTLVPIGLAQVCIVAPTGVPCAITAADGTWTLAAPFLPGNVDMAMSFTATGYLGYVSLQHERDSSSGSSTGYLSGVPLFADPEATTLLVTQAGFTYPTSTTGFVRVVIEDAVGVTATLSPASGTGPVYTNTDGAPDPALTATSSSTFESLAYFGNVAPGMYSFTATVAGKTCYDRPNTPSTEPEAGDWPPTGAATTTVQIVAGAMTDDIHVHCF